MYCMWDVLGTNERFSGGKPTAVRLSTSNSAYTQRVKWMKEQDKWRDQHDKLVTTVTPEESIQLHVKEITTKTKDTPISYQQERVTKVCSNDLAPLFDKIVDQDGKIPSVKQVSDIQEELCVTYFNSITSDNPADPVSSEDEATEAGRLEDMSKDRGNKLDKSWNKLGRRPTRLPIPACTDACMLIKLEVAELLPQRVLLFTLRHLLRHIPESPLILLAFLLHCLHPGLVVLIIPLQTLLTTSVFHVQTHREPRTLTGLLHPEWFCKSRAREQAKWKLVRRWIYRFVVILQHKTARPTSKQMVKQTHFRFVFLFCPNS